MRIRSNSWMQSTGQTSTHERSLMSMQGSAMMYVTRASLAASSASTTRCPSRREPRELGDQLGRPLDERGLHDHLVEARCVRALEARLVRVVRVPDDRNVGPGVDDLLRLDPRDVRDHEIGRSDAVARHEPVPGKQALELPAEEEVDPSQQDRRHGADTSTARGRR